MEFVITVCSVSIRLVVIYRMPASKVNGLKVSSFCDEFSDYIEKLSCASGHIMIVGDFNINYLDPSGCEYKRFVNILDTFDFVQNIELPTHSSGHLLDYVITRKNSTYASNFMVSDFISDHRVLHVSLTCMRAHPVRKLINFRSLNRINEGSLVLDVDNIDISSECTDVNVLVKQYDDSLSRILDKHAPLKRMYVVERPMNDWITDNILALKKIRRKHESIWRRTRLTIHFDLYKESCKAVKQAIIESKAKITQQKIRDCNGDQKKLFKIVDPLLGRNKTTVLPEYSDPATLASTINTFIIEKLTKLELNFLYLRSICRHFLLWIWIILYLYVPLS